ncbi:MAG: SDR family NAD(P)-dependent oxidoreductase, partial [Acidimicrobiia bacterium]
MRYEGKLTIVTGGASGIGAATVRRLASEGAHVAVVDVDADAGAGIASEVAGVAVGLDIADLDAIPGAIDRLVDETGNIDLLVNCAGWDRAMP